MATHHPIRKHVPAPEIPDKLYFRIGDVARLLEVPAYVLRFWETEFPNLRPNKGGTGQRLYRKKDVELALRIKSLLYDQGYTIPGARQVFKQEAKPNEIASFPSSAASDPGAQGSVLATREGVGVDLSRDRALSALRADLRSLHTLLSKPVADIHSSVGGRVTSMRPRLVLEPTPIKTPRPEPGKPTLQLHQRDLFGTFDEDPGPQAS